MNVPGYHLAQLNIARMKFPIDSPEMADFMARLEPVNALADAAEGFIWRLQTEEGNATSIDFFGSDMIVNMSVWTDLPSLRNFVYRGGHAAVMARRKAWFERLDEAYTVLWWIRSGTRPGLDEARNRLTSLRRNGPTPEAFTFKQSFAPPGGDRSLRVD